MLVVKREQKCEEESRINKKSMNWEVLHSL
jgi:hypothetical protein